MKKVFLLTALIFLLNSCFSNLPPTPIDDTETKQIPLSPNYNQLPEEPGSPPIYNSIDFNSVEELIETISAKSFEEVISTIEERRDNTSFHPFIANILNNYIYFPMYKNKEIPYQNNADFYNISIYPSELYGKPWIFFFPNKEQFGNSYISTTYLDDTLIG